MGAAIATIIHQFVTFGRVYREVEHVVASIAKLHGCILYVGIIDTDTNLISDCFNFGVGIDGGHNYIWSCVI